jgi:hypothetical protein
MEDYAKTIQSCKNKWTVDYFVHLEYKWYQKTRKNAKYNAILHSAF